MLILTVKLVKTLISHDLRKEAIVRQFQMKDDDKDLIDVIHNFQENVTDGFFASESQWWIKKPFEADKEIFDRIE